MLSVVFLIISDKMHKPKPALLYFYCMYLLKEIITYLQFHHITELTTPYNTPVGINNNIKSYLFNFKYTCAAIHVLFVSAHRFTNSEDIPLPQEIVHN